MTAVQTLDLQKKFKDKTAVDGLNLSVEEGELLALLGVNGAGKTTTIRMLCCLSKPTAGDALLLGKSIRKEPEAVKAMLNLSPQETAVAPNLSVRENLELIAGLYGCDRKLAGKGAGRSWPPCPWKRRKTAGPRRCPAAGSGG